MEGVRVVMQNVDGGFENMTLAAVPAQGDLICSQHGGEWLFWRVSQVIHADAGDRIANPLLLCARASWAEEKWMPDFLHGDGNETRFKLAEKPRLADQPPPDAKAKR
jgi:hypothetical protein